MHHARLNGGLRVLEQRLRFVRLELVVRVIDICVFGMTAEEYAVATGGTSLWAALAWYVQ